VKHQAVLHFLILSQFLTGLNGYRMCSDHAWSINEDINPDNHLLWYFQQKNMQMFLLCVYGIGRGIVPDPM